MTVPTVMSDLSTTIASNSPAGSDAITAGDDNIRALMGIVRREASAGSDVASASTITPDALSSSANLTGTTTVTTIASTNSWDGRVYMFRHTGAHSFTHSSTLVFPDAVSHTFASGDISFWRQRTSGTWDCVGILQAALVGNFASINVTGSTAPSAGIYRSTTNTLSFASAGTLRASVGASGNWTFAAPSSGTTLTATGVGTIIAQFDGVAGGTAAAVVNSDATTHYAAFNPRQAGNNTAFFGTDGTQGLCSGSTDGDTIIRGEAGAIRLSIAGAAATLAVDATSTTVVGSFYRNVRTASGATSFALTDVGGIVIHTGTVTGHAFTIPPNASVAFPVGACIYLMGASGSSGAACDVTRGAGVSLRNSAGTNGDVTVGAAGAILIQEATLDRWRIWQFA